MIKNAVYAQLITVRSKRWMYGITVICLVIFTTLLAVNLVVLFNRTSAAAILSSSSAVVFLCACFLVLGLTFFVNPNFIYGNLNIVIENSIPVPIACDIVDNSVIELQPLERVLPDIELVERLEGYLSVSKLYLEAGLTLSKLAVATAIPSYKLSELLNHHYEKNFNAYINVWRIKYIVQRLEAGDHKFLTLEALANEAGFTSRNSFFTAFKKEMHVSPSAYIAALKRITA